MRATAETHSPKMSSKAQSRLLITNQETKIFWILVYYSLLPTIYIRSHIIIRFQSKLFLLEMEFLLKPQIADRGLVCTID